MKRELTSFTAYQRWANSLSNGDLAPNAALAVAALGLAGEAGEFADTIKKYIGQGHELNDLHLIDELGDMLWYIAYACLVLDIDLQTIVNRNYEKLTERYGDKFSAERSRNRKRVTA